MSFQLSGTDPLTVFAAIAVLIFLGFLGNLIFSRLRFNDTLILIAVGVLLGPLAEHWTGDPVIAKDPVLAISGVVGPLALILILFDGGLALRLHDLRHGLGRAAGLACLGFILTSAAVGGITAVALDVPLLTGLILGAILGGTSALVVLPSLVHIRCERRTATTLGLESALTDVLVVVVATTLIAIIADERDLDAARITSSIGTTFLVAVAFGAIAGFSWLWVIPGVRDKAYGYMLTLGVMFSLYVVTEWYLGGLGLGKGGAGPLAVLAFGFVLGNHSSLGKSIRERVGEDFGQGMKRFQGEIAFLVRTFFFVYLGLLVDLHLFTQSIVWAVGVLLFAAMMAARYLAVATMQRRWRFQGDDWVLWVMMPRGLAAAVLAAIPAQRGIQGTDHFVALAFLLLVLTNLSATVGGLVLERRQRNAPEPLPSRPSKAKETGMATKSKGRKGTKGDKKAKA